MNRLFSPNSTCTFEGHAPAADDSQIGKILESYLQSLERGDSPDIDALLRQHPDLADQLEPSLRKLAALHQMAERLQSPETTDPLADVIGQDGTLGDYRIIRELGRGGMGIVYEAQQISLARRVALKVLPFAAVLDPRHLQRFKNEALAAAHLDHPNIVEVYGVGCERGIHFYAMRYVEGQTLAAVIEALRLAVAGTATLECDDSSSLSVSNDARFAKNTTAIQKESCDKSQHSKDTVVAALSTLRTERPKEFYRRVAELGIQAAEALDHAHQMGIVHRDIKPSNLMLDGSGKLWVTDFGLARIESGTTLTMTGDFLGTLRYMSPEQGLGKRAVVDYRTDIYSLGITLYELLTHRPAFDGADREKVLHQVAFEEPMRPRKLNPAIPLDLETIIRKAVEKGAQDRYQTARDLTDDLRRYLKDEPVRAKAPGAILRLRKWSRRHKEFVAAAAVILVLISLGSTISSLVVTDAYRAEARHRQLAEDNLDLALEALDAVYLEAIGEDKLLRPPAVNSDELANITTNDQPLSALERELLQRGLEFYDRFARRNDASADARLRTAQAYYRVAYLHGGLGNREAAQRAFRAAIARLESVATEKTTDADFYQQLADAYGGFAFVVPDWSARRANLEKARTAIGAAIVLEPNNYRLYLKRGDMAAHMRYSEQGARDYQKALQLGADDPELLRLSAERAKWGEVERAVVERLAARAVELAPDDPQCHLMLARVLGEL